MMRWFDFGMPGWGGMIMMIGTALFWMLIIGIVLVAAFHLPRRDRGPDPHRLLDERFARGEIGEREYRHRLRVLAGHPEGPRDTVVDGGEPPSGGRDE